MTALEFISLRADKIAKYIEDNGFNNISRVRWVTDIKKARGKLIKPARFCKRPFDINIKTGVTIEDVSIEFGLRHIYIHYRKVADKITTVLEVRILENYMLTDLYAATYHSL